METKNLTTVESPFIKKGKNLYLVIDTKSQSSSQKESSSEFLCPSGTVMTGRYHKGDENGTTCYEYATLKAVDSKGNVVDCTISIENVTWSSAIKESSDYDFRAPKDKVIVGRRHSGDEKGNTYYAYADVKVDGMATTLIDGIISEKEKESSIGWFRASENHVIVGRLHYGDENGKTSYVTARIVCIAENPFSLIGSVNIVVDERRRTEAFTESDSLFEAPPGTVMTGRSHVGDENGDTYYEYATLKGAGTATGVCSIGDERWESFNKNKGDTDYDAPVGRVIIGRRYEGDENGSVQYKTGVVYYNGKKTETYDFGISEARHENGGWNWFVAPDNSVITGRHHYGDETGNTYYCYGHVRVNGLVRTLGRLRIIIMMDHFESYFPMRPDDFITLSRFRRHVEGGSDDGYNKLRGCFVIGNNDHTSEYYNIPVSVINSYHTTGEDFYFNLRPRDRNSVGKGEVFLEPDDNLRGDHEPTGRVPVYYYSESGITPQKGNNGNIQFFVFFGFNEYEAVGPINWNHQGDWEEIQLAINSEGKIRKAWLSQHGEMKEFESDKLDISYDGDVQVLKVYCHRGTHAFSNEGESGGYPWIISECALPLLSQPWHLYEGAWGEVGIYIKDFNPAATTGPLGPTQMNCEYSDDDVKISDLIKSYEVLLIPYNRSGASVETEADHEFVTDENKILTGRKHSGDEKQATTYEQASLKAVDINGNELDYLIEVVGREWVYASKESQSGTYYIAPEGYVITGRKHSGDENGDTQYQIAKVYVNHRLAKTSTFKSDSFPQKFGICESAGILVKAPSKFIITGRTHTGDENGRTYYYISYLHADKDPE